VAITFEGRGAERPQPNVIVLIINIRVTTKFNCLRIPAEARYKYKIKSRQCRRIADRLQGVLAKCIKGLKAGKAGMPETCNLDCLQ